MSAAPPSPAADAAEKTYTLHHGDCLATLRGMADCSVDAVVTDPPYGLSFMGKKWDYDVPSTEIWAECLRVLRPGGHLLAFAGTRTQHRMAVRIEDAGFEIRDMIAWVYGSGFPKSMDASKAIDKAAGAEREVVGIDPVRHERLKNQIAGSVSTGEQWEHGGRDVTITAPATEAAQQWQGWGTALKPALEPITVARKPLIGTVVANVLEHGTGALNIDGCRVATDPSVDDPRLGGSGAWKTDKAAANVYEGGYAGQEIASSALGRWPANLIHDGSDEVLTGFPQTTSGMMKAGTPYPGGNVYGAASGATKADTIGDSGSAARFFYCAKASKQDRDEGLENFDGKQAAGLPMRSADGERGGEGLDGTKTDRLTVRKNVHPTVKPTDLMRYLLRLVTPPGGIALDPFMGSGSTGKAAMLEGFQFVGCELSPEYIEIARARIHAAWYEKYSETPDMFT